MVDFPLLVTWYVKWEDNSLRADRLATGICPLFENFPSCCTFHQYAFLLTWKQLT